MPIKHMIATELLEICIFVSAQRDKGVPMVLEDDYLTGKTTATQTISDFFSLYRAWEKKVERRYYMNYPANKFHSFSHQRNNTTISKKV
jgi:hypothetical protein